MKGGKTFFFIIGVVVVQLVVIVAIFSVNEHNLLTGKEIVLELYRPVDPRSLLQGDYIRLSYEISRLPDHPQAKSVHRILLAPDTQGIYRFRGFHDGGPVGKDEVVINGRYDGGRFVYGIEHFYVQEETGLALEQAATHVLVVVPESGNAMVKEVLTNLPRQSNGE